jgi:hypothetical protein
VPKITKRDPFFSFQSATPLFHDERASFTLFPGAKKARTVRLQSPKSTILPSKNKKLTPRQTHTQTVKIRSDLHIQNSKFRFKSREKRTRGSERRCAPRLLNYELSLNLKKFKTNDQNTLKRAQTRSEQGHNGSHTLTRTPNQKLPSVRTITMTTSFREHINMAHRRSLHWKQHRRFAAVDD